MTAFELFNMETTVERSRDTRFTPGLFNQRQIELVQTFADQAVIAIENVRLFDEVQQRTKELAVSLDDLRTAQDRLVQTEKFASLGQLTAGIAHVQPVFESDRGQRQSVDRRFLDRSISLLDGVAHLASFTPTTPEADDVLQGCLSSGVEAVH